MTGSAIDRTIDLSFKLKSLDAYFLFYINYNRIFFDFNLIHKR